MVYTAEDRLESLAKAREARKAKSEAKKQYKLDNPAKMGRPRKIKEVKEVPEEQVVGKPEPEVEIEEQVICQKIAKPKKKIIRKIIQQYESSSEEEVEEVIYKPRREERAKIRVQLPERDIEHPTVREREFVPVLAPKRNMFFSY